MSLTFRLLGPTEVRHGETVLPAIPAKQRVLLAVLLLRAGRTVTVAELADALWESPPGNPRNAVQTYVRRLRALLPEPCVCTTATGYLVETTADQVDVHRFRRLVREAGQPGAAERNLLHEALALWRGTALLDVPSAALREHAAALAAERVRALERRVALDLAAGAHDELVAELRVLTAEHPLHEHFWAQLMHALIRAGRRAEALQIYQQATDTLRELLGTRPGQALRETHRAILGGELSPAPKPQDRNGIPVHQLPLDIAGFTGRSSQVADILRAPEGCTVVYGQPGVGKTALAVHCGHRLKERFPDGQLYVDLRGHSPSEALTAGAVLARFRAGRAAVGRGRAAPAQLAAAVPAGLRHQHPARHHGPAALRRAGGPARAERRAGAARAHARGGRAAERVGGPLRAGARAGGRVGAGRGDRVGAPRFRQHAAGPARLQRDPAG
ncbi:DNA-binding SARP family transcriptional activator [Crossiella equi]|uniref:DNA-binding SARP family transcriptional activator n=1 Tax=Crossiella equi TaxID=130796 RepID=A0ABS5ABW8_9PSEU|nr:BTAD domain-containing putative transcriptional regulator [Crossiella equi]MBP2473777.1 DNA-binding SARP family transcriptional activator [Crossiella equi]